MISIFYLPAVVGPLDQNYYYKSVATQIPLDAVLPSVSKRKKIQNINEALLLQTNYVHLKFSAVLQKAVKKENSGCTKIRILDETLTPG